VPSAILQILLNLTLTNGTLYTKPNTILSIITKTGEMEANTSFDNKQKDAKQVGLDTLSKEQLIGIVVKQQEMIQKADVVINEMNMNNVQIRIDTLFRVLDHSDDFDNEFVNYCRKELKERIYIKDEQQDNKDNKQ
jgi:hypothetical protein